MIGEEGKIVERWIEYFTEMLNKEKEDKEDEENYKRYLIVKPDHVVEQPKEICKEPTRQEIRYAIKRMRNNRVHGEDTIVVELREYGGEAVVDAVHELLKLIWTTENMPQEWNIGIICPIYKKGNKLKCCNYRDITLLNKAYKIFSSILNERLKTATEKIIGEYQCGFRRNKSTIDQMFVLRQMMEKRNEHGLNLHMLFNDLKQAFDSINWKRLFEAMDKMGMPQ
jgi:sorting nexin-29